MCPSPRKIGKNERYTSICYAIIRMSSNGDVAEFEQKHKKSYKRKKRKGAFFSLFLIVDNPTRMVYNIFIIF